MPESVGEAGDVDCADGGREEAAALDGAKGGVPVLGSCACLKPLSGGEAAEEWEDVGREVAVAAGAEDAARGTEAWKAFVALEAAPAPAPLVQWLAAAAPRAG